LRKNKPKYHQIIDAAVITIAENGYHQTQVSKIAKQAGVADGTIYLYFKNKEDILISLFQEKMANFIEKIKEIIAGKQTAAEKIFMIIENHFRILSQNPKMAVVTQLELRQSNQELRQRINNVLKEYLDFMEQILREGVESGEFPPDLNTRIARQMLFGTIDEIATTWVMNKQKYDLVALAPTVAKLLLKGLLEEK
jgi:TetR/AcrR family fatty acid metabolism transcriptional regulator